MDSINLIDRSYLLKLIFKEKILDIKDLQNGTIGTHCKVISTLRKLTGPNCFAIACRSQFDYISNLYLLDTFFFFLSQRKIQILKSWTFVPDNAVGLL